MDVSMESATASNACIPCKQHKRKCNRTAPACGTCVRVGRECHYDSWPNQVDLQGSLSAAVDLPRLHHIAFPLPKTGSIDPFRFSSLSQPTLDIFATQHAFEVLGDVKQVEATAKKYFSTIYLRMPIISQKRFFNQLPTLYSNPRADFTVLCLCIHVLIQRPEGVEFAKHYAQTMQSSCYVMVKSFIGVLQSLTIATLELVQAMVLMAFYEMGHAMYSAASTSIATCAKAARAIGLPNKRYIEVPNDDAQAMALFEQHQRVWWAISNLDRFINFCTGDKILATDDSRPNDNLPMELEAWENDADGQGLVLSTPENVRVGPFARECQISHLVGRVIRHVFDPSADGGFQKEEALRLERTLNAFLPLLMDQEKAFGLFCAALGLCSSALFMLYDAALLSGQYEEDERQAVLTSLESTSTRIAVFSNFLFADPSQVDSDKMSPFVPYSLYQAAVVQYRCWKQTGQADYQVNLDSLKMILSNFKKRWLVAGKYLDCLETLEDDWPIAMLFMHGTSLSDRGPTGDPSVPYVS